MSDSDCLFCQIAAGEQSADLVHRGDETVAFRDINAQAPTHVLVIPRRHIPSVNALGSGDEELVGRLFTVAQRIAREEGIADSGYRLTMNAGDDAGQSVGHIHLHLLGGRRLGWPPG